MNRTSFRGGQAGGMGTVPGGPLGKARLALASGRPDEAERLSRKLLERQPTNAAARLVLAQALLQTRQIAAATAEVRRVIREQPANADAHMLLSAALVQQGQFRVPEEAETAARRAVQLQPKLARAHVQLAEVLASKREFRAARAEADAALQIEPRNATAHLMRALVLLSDKDPAGAVVSAEAALRYDRTLAQAEYIRANALKEVRRYDDALASLDTATRANPMLGGTNVHTIRGQIYFKQRKYRQSYGEYLSAQRMSGKLVQIAPVLAALNMVLSVFGQNAPYVLAAIIAVLVILILTGVGFIPVAGPWIVAVLAAAVVAVVVFAAVRYTRGAIVPAGDANSRLFAIGGAGIAAIIGFIVVVAIWFGIAVGAVHAHYWFYPVTLGVALSAAAGAAALALYYWPKAMGRYMPRRAA